MTPGARSYFTTKKVSSVADMKGLKIRMQNNAMMVDMTNVLGGTGVTGIGPNEVYPPSSRAPSTALRTTGRPTRTWRLRGRDLLRARRAHPRAGNPAGLWKC